MSPDPTAADAHAPEPTAADPLVGDGRGGFLQYAGGTVFTSWPSLDELLAANALTPHGGKAYLPVDGVAPGPALSPLERDERAVRAEERCQELLSALGTLIGEPVLGALAGAVTDLGECARSAVLALSEIDVDLERAQRCAWEARENLQAARRTAALLEADHADARAWALGVHDLDIDSNERLYTSARARGDAA